MGKGTKKKTVWRTFSFENGYTNGTNDADTNGLTASSHHQKNGLDNDVSSRSSMSNGKFVANWRTQQRYDGDDENDGDTKYHIDSNGSVNNSCTVENGHYRAFYKRTSLTDKYPLRGNGLRKTSSHFQENGTKHDFHDIHENSTMQKTSQFRSNRLTKVAAVSHHANHKKWDSRNGNYNTNGILSNHSRGFRKSQFAHSDQSANENNNTDEHFNENGVVKNARNADDSDKCQDKVNGGNSSAQQRPDQHQRSLQLNKFNEDEYTRISTPRSEVLFKKGYLMRDKKYVGPTNTMSTTATTSSSNDSGSVSVVSNEETASYYSIQSMSPDNSTYLNGNNSSDSNSATYPNGDGFEHDLSLIYSSGFYDNNGYFYVNPYIHNNFDQFNGPPILMPYGSAPTTKDIDDYDADAFPPAPISPGATDAKSIDEEHPNNYNSINSEDMSNSSLSENTSINNDPDTPPNPLTPPPSPLSPDKKPIARSEASECDKPMDENLIENRIENETDTQIETQNGQDITETIPNEEQEELPETEGDATVPDNYSMPYFSPIIFVPPIPFVPDARMAGSRRGKFRRHPNNHFGRPKRSNRFLHFYNKVYIPSNWSEAPDEMAQNDTNEEEMVEAKSGEENAVATSPAPTIEQCDTILKNSKLNLNVSEFIPQSKRMIFVPLPIPPSPPASVYFVPIPSTESTLNVNVPEFLPKNYKPMNAEADEMEVIDGATSSATQIPPQSTATAAEAMATSTTKMTIITNESAKENQNETTNIHTNGLNTNTKCTTQSAALDNQHVKTNGVHTNASNAMKNENNNNNNNSKNSNNHKNKPDYVAAIKQNDVTVTIMSDLLKTNNDNLNLDACSFNNENSHTNLKADLGIKKITNNISKNKVYKNDNNCNDSGSSKSIKIMNNNKNAKTRHAYPKTKETPQQKPCDNGHAANKNNENANIEMGSKTMSDDGKKMTEKSIEKSGLTYAQMVVPIKLTDAKTTPEMTDAKVTNDAKVMADVKVAGPEPSKLSRSPFKGKYPQNNNRKSHPIKKRTVPENRNERPKPIEGSVEWFTVGAKGKKHVASNGSTVTEIAFENESNVEKVNKIAEELQLDINKDADLAMDIMDSLTIAEEKQEETVVKAPQKKKITAKPRKKATKDKVNKEQKRHNTFDIIEPKFESPKNEEASQSTENAIDEIAPEQMIEIVEAEKDTTDSTLDNFVFDPNVFATPCNLQMDSMQRSASAKLGNSLRLSTGKSVRNLINPFDVYQKEFTSIENQQLKQEEEMVIKILQQLNKSFDGKETTHKNEIIETVPEVLEVASIETTMVNHHDARENSVERFAINAKPYQNVYSSNHFLEHFFGDRNDKCDQVVISTDLSSSDQSYVEEDNDDNLHGHFNTYPVIGSDEIRTEIDEHKMEMEYSVKSIESGIESADESIKDETEENLHDEKIECKRQNVEIKNAEKPTENGFVFEINEHIEIQLESIKSENETEDENELNREMKSESGIEDKIDDSKAEVFNITKALEQILQRRSELEVESKVEQLDRIQAIESEVRSDEERIQESHTQEKEVKKPEEGGQKSEKEAQMPEKEIELEVTSMDSVVETETAPENKIETAPELEIEIESRIEEENLTETQSKTSSTVELEQKTKTQAFEITEDVSRKQKEDALIEVNVSNEELNKETVESISAELTESINCEQIEENESICDKSIEINSNETETVLQETESVQYETKSAQHESEPTRHEQIELIDDESAKPICDKTQQQQESVCENSEPTVQIEIQSEIDHNVNEQKNIAITETEAEPMSLETETSSIEIDAHEVASSASCNQSVKSNSSNSTRPWLRIVDTQMLQQQKKLQQTFPITTAVSMWLNQVQKEKTPELFRVPDNRFFSTTAATAAAVSTKYKKQDSQTSHSNSSIDLTEDTASITSDKFHINDDEEEDIMNFWESPTLLTPQSSTPPPIYNSVYGSSINYANLISNKNELLCNNIIDYDHAANGKHNETHDKLNNKHGFNQNNNAGDSAKPAIDDKCYRPPEVCCTIM